MAQVATIDAQKLKKAVDVILSGTADRLDLDDNTKVYRCAGIIRIDIKIREVSGE